MRLRPMDKVMEISTGKTVRVNSAHYLIDLLTQEQGVSICGRPDKVYPASAFKFIHRCDFKPYKGIRRCECGAIYTTAADSIKPENVVEH